MQSGAKMADQNSIICPIRRRVISEANITVVRKLPDVSKIVVKKGEKLDPETVLAETETSPGYRKVKITDILGVKSQDIAKFLKREAGGKIYRGEIIAEKPGTFGLGKKIITSPVDGIVKEINKDEGTVTIEYLPTPAKIASVIPGEVMDISDKSKIKVLANVSQIHGVLGIGRERSGFIKVPVKPDDFLLPHNLDASCQKAIVVGGAIISRDTLEKALAIGVSGIITGGIHVKDFESVGGRKILPINNLNSDVGLTILVTEGYGRIPMGEDIWSTLFLLNGKLGLISGDEKVLTVPVENAKNEAPPDTKERELKVGDTVRIIADIYFGSVGKTVEIASVDEILPSGIKTRMVTVKVNKQNHKIPYQNIEILE